MKILMLGWELPPHNSGGLGVACYYMSKALAIAGAKIDFVVPYEAPHDEVDFMTVHGATALSPSRHSGLNAYDSANVLGGNHGGMRAVQSQYVTFVEQFVENKQFDAIHAHDWLTMEAGMRAKQLTDAPLIVHVHATEFDRSGEHYGNPVVHEIEQQALLMADRIVAVSNITKSIIVQRYNIPADKIDVIHNAIDVASLGVHDYDQTTYKYLEELKIEGYTIVGTLTRLTVQKGLAHFLKAAARATQKYDKLAFVLAGDGEQRDELLALSAELGIADKVFFTGFVRGKKWRDVYSLLDIFVMSSVSEPFGLTALEAAHHDSALIITHQSGVGEVLHSIFRYDFWDVDALADQIVGIATSDALASELKSNVRQEYDRISWHDVAQQCMTLYARMKTGATV